MTSRPPRNESKAPIAPDARVITVDGRIVWQAIGAILFTLAVLWAVGEASELVAMIAISFFFSLALQPGVAWLVEHRGWRRGAAVGVIYLAGAILVTLMIAVILPSLADLARLIGARGSEWMDDFNQWASNTLGIDPQISGDTVAGAGDTATGFLENPFGTVLGIAAGGVTLLFHMMTIATFTFYFAADAPRIRRATLRIFSPETQERIGWTWDQAIIQTGGYFYSRLLLMIINGLGFFFTMVLVGLPVGLALGLAVFAGFVSEFIPVIGTYIGGAVPVALALALQGLTAGVIVLAYVIVYQQVENLFLSPKLSTKTMTLSGGLAFGAALFGGAIAGPMGAFTALPIAALITSFMSNYVADNEVVYDGPEDVEPAGTDDAPMPEGLESRG